MEPLPYYAEAASRAATAAGALLIQQLGRHGPVKTKRSAIDLVTRVDRASERLIRRLLLRADPRIGFLGEERGARNRAAACRWIVDPLDGTTNFVHGLPLFGVSIGLQEAGTIRVGVIYDPVRRELFAATKGGGAFLNGRRICVSAASRLSRSLLSTGFSSRFLAHNQPYAGWFRTLQRHSHGVRRIGSSVWCLAAVAAGRLEGFYERDLWPWDMAAGVLLVAEAGGTVTDLAGHPPVLERGRLVATNGRIHRELLRALSLK
ncbi:MAG: inositol monophosphatase [Candidatus Omnitrophica bacterium]|nr:inositol monophosphatase [Candidatus Omnitrophota bacterium]